MFQLKDRQGTQKISNGKVLTSWISLTVLFSFMLFGLLHADVANAQVYKGYTLEEFEREPVPFATVTLRNRADEVVGHTSTDENGFFRIEAPEVAEYFLHVSRIGYSENMAGPFLIERNDTLNIQIRVLEVSSELDEIVVEAENYDELVEQYLEDTRFYSRQQRGLGRFFTYKEIQERNITRLSQLFTGMSIRVQDGALFSSRADCKLMIYLNGQEYFQDRSLTLMESSNRSPGNFILDHLSIEKILGVEVYSGIVGQPPQFGSSSSCGALYIWTI